jgi:hypothetical protein
MPIAAAAIILIQVLLAIHVAKTGRQLYWIMIIVMLPLIGSAAYFFAEMLPELRNNPSARRAVRNVANTIDPAREKKKIEAQLAVADTVQNRLRLAREHLDLGDFLNAEELFQSSLRGPHATDPDIMLGLAQSQFGRGDAAATRKTLDALKAANPDYRSTDGHLLYARSLEALGDNDAAILEYQVLATSYPGEEGRARYALLLKRMNRGPEAQKVFADVLARAKIAPRYYQRANREWIELAREQAAGTEASKR